MAGPLPIIPSRAGEPFFPLPPLLIVNHRFLVVCPFVRLFAVIMGLLSGNQGRVFVGYVCEAFFTEFVL
jgi:hypothetical protein